MASFPNQRLFVAALENGSVEILDIQRGERAAEIKGLEEPQGLYYDSKTGRLYVATGGDGELRIYDGKSLAVQEPVGFGGDADNVRYDEQTGNIWVGYGKGGIAVANAAGQHVGSVALDSHPESFQFEPNGDRVYVNIPKQFAVAVVDRKKRAVVAKWGLGVQFGNYPMALDDTHKRLFVGAGFPPSWSFWIQRQDGSSPACRPLGTLTTFSMMATDKSCMSLGAKGRWKLSGSVIPIITNQREG